MALAYQALIDPTKLVRHMAQPLRTKYPFGFHRDSESLWLLVSCPGCPGCPGLCVAAHGWFAAMSSCNALPVIVEISPTMTAGCISQTSCNAPGASAFVMPSF